MRIRPLSISAIVPAGICVTPPVLEATFDETRRFPALPEGVEASVPPICDTRVGLSAHGIL